MFIFSLFCFRSFVVWPFYTISCSVCPVRVRVIRLAELGGEGVVVNWKFKTLRVDTCADSISFMEFQKAPVD